MQPTTGRSLGLAKAAAWSVPVANQKGTLLAAAIAAEVFRKSRRVCGVRDGWSLLTGRLLMGGIHREVRAKTKALARDFSLINGNAPRKTTSPRTAVRGLWCDLLARFVI